MGHYVHDNENEYASKGVAGTGLGLGIAGTALALLNNNGCCNGGGLLGNLLGGNRCSCGNNMAAFAESQYVSQLQAENARLKSENYSDKVAKEVYAQSLADNRTLRDEVMAFIKPLADEAVNNRVNLATLAAEQKCCCEKQALQAEITAGKINETALALNGKIDTQAAINNGTFNSLNQTIACISGDLNTLTRRFNNLTQENVSLCKVCPQPMQRFNTWATPTAQAPDCGSCCSRSTTAASATDAA